MSDQFSCTIKRVFDESSVKNRNQLNQEDNHVLYTHNHTHTHTQTNIYIYIGEHIQTNEKKTTCYHIEKTATIIGQQDEGSRCRRFAI
jgi:hypothetical protein